MVHIHCDRCKADIDPEDKIGKMSWGFKNGIEGIVSSDLLYGRVYCERCMDLCMAFIQSDTEPARGQIKADKRGKPRLQCGDQFVVVHKHLLFIFVVVQIILHLLLIQSELFRDLLRGQPVL